MAAYPGQSAPEVVSVDVLVIGAGPTGLAAANLLVDHGLTVALVEQRPGTSDDPRAISATDETLRVMQQIGVVDDLLSESLTDTGARYYGLGERLLAEVRPPVSAAGYRLGHPAKSQFDQPVMEALLLEAAEARGVDLHFRTAVESIRNTSDDSHGPLAAGVRQGVRVQATRSGPRRRGLRGATDPEALAAPEPSGEIPVEFRASWVLACDGGRSTARRETGIELTGSTQVERWVVLDLLDVAGDPEPFSSFHCNAERPTVVVPGVNGRRRYEFMLFDGEDPDAMTSLESITRLVAPYQDIGHVTVRRSAVYTAHRRVAQTYRSGHVLLAGDAAHLMPPFAGQGLNAGIRDAAGVAWRLAAVLRHGAPESLLDEYERERKDHVTEMVKLSARIGSIVMNTSRWQSRLRDAAIRGTRLLPPLHRWLTRMRFLKQPHYTDGTVVPPNRGLPRVVAEVVGTAVPQPWVATSRGREVLLDEVLGTGWKVIEVSRRPGGAVALTVESAGRPSSEVEGEAQTVVERAGVFAAWAGHALLVRPDRYVAAAATPDVINREVAKLQPRVGRL